MPGRFVVLLAVLLLVSSCAESSADPPDSQPTGAVETPAPLESSPTPAATATLVPEPTATSEATPTAVPAATAVPEATPTAAPEPERDCSPSIPDDLQVSHASLAVTSIEISQAIYDCAHEVGLAFADDPAAISTLMSRGIQGPLLLVGPWFDIPMMGELGRLAPERIVTAGFDAQVLRYALADFAFEPIAVNQQAAFSPDGLSGSRVWLADNAELGVPLAALGHQIGVGVFVLSGDLRALSPETRNAISNASEVELLFGLSDAAAWQLEVVRRGDQIPGGGLLMFDAGFDRRLVAMYGHPSGPGLGVLGEQGPEEGVERLRSIAEGYDADGSVVLPTLEIIATVASAGAGEDGDYSAETARDVIRPWVELAAANDMYVVLDLQPGRSDYLSQARIYEEFLRLPHVGLALDPEWRLKPGEVHMRQIGTVDAAEINHVVRWLAGIVREEALPQKLLILHQFQLQMITNRHLVETPPELAVLIHMDGQGPLQAKYDTWNLLTSRRDADQFYWGWKNFYDEDIPTATPEQVLKVTPVPLFVSFQ
ncbi:hypothetical protein [Candidatus Poriferisocius sp.]|uniref:hypothetical protein n=1 Tax=Candidatus Poriferisocius sp. TaxID=3101276 RepID=UPI003B025CCB